MKTRLLESGNLLLEIGPSHPEYRTLRERTLGELLQQFRDRGGLPTALSHAPAHSPVGGVTIGGTFYPVGQFIHGDVMATATEAEKRAGHGDAELAPAVEPLSPPVAKRKSEGRKKR